jgi:hypothetical protein
MHGDRIGPEPDSESRSRRLSLLVGLPGLEPGTSSLSATHREPLCGPPLPQVASDCRHRSYRVYRPAATRSPLVPDLAGHSRFLWAICRGMLRSLQEPCKLGDEQVPPGRLGKDGQVLHGVVAVRAIRKHEVSPAVPC